MKTVFGQTTMRSLGETDGLLFLLLLLLLILIVARVPGGGARLGLRLRLRLRRWRRCLTQWPLEPGLGSRKTPFTNAPLFRPSGRLV